MAVHYRAQGFVVKKTDRGESDRLFTIYTKEFGKLEILGRAIRKIKSKLRSGIELFYLSEVEFIQGKTNKTLTDTIIIKNFQKIRQDLKKLAIAHKISENLDDLVRGQEPDKEIWELLGETFEKLNNGKLKIADWKIIYYYFIWNLFSALGYQPELYCCSSCQKKLTPSIFYFGLDLGGVVCHQCVEEPKKEQAISQDEIKVLRILLGRDWSVLSKLKINASSYKLLKKISENYLSEILEKN